MEYLMYPYYLVGFVLFGLGLKELASAKKKLLAIGLVFIAFPQVMEAAQSIIFGMLSTNIFDSESGWIMKVLHQSSFFVGECLIVLYLFLYKSEV